jgi:hypothetical protein
MTLTNRELAAALRLIADRILYELLLVGEKGEYALVVEAADRLEKHHMALVGPGGETHSSLKHPSREGMPAVGTSPPMPPPNVKPAVPPMRLPGGRGHRAPPPPAEGDTFVPLGIAAAAAMRPAVDIGLRRIVARGLAEIMGKAVLSDRDQEILMQAIHVVSRE